MNAPSDNRCRRTAFLTLGITPSLNPARRMAGNRQRPPEELDHRDAAYGYVFVDSKLTADLGFLGDVLARIDVSVYPASRVAYINCQMGIHITAAGWLITGGAAPATLRYWKYQSTDPVGNPINVSSRIVGSTQISAAQAAMMRDPTVVLTGWQPPP